MRALCPMHVSRGGASVSTRVHWALGSLCLAGCTGWYLYKEGTSRPRCGPFMVVQRTTGVTWIPSELPVLQGNSEVYSRLRRMQLCDKGQPRVTKSQSALCKQCVATGGVASSSTSQIIFVLFKSEFQPYDSRSPIDLAYGSCNEERSARLPGCWPSGGGDVLVLVPSLGLVDLEELS